ncbi:MAG: polymer-forming cytoskeletal protein [Hyphomicrobium sp.]|jgi:cytoskeletal protein CcmA (bactofilin family)
MRLLTAQCALVVVFVSCLTASLAVNPQDAIAKVPGGQHCHGGVCHTVLTVKETGRLVGQRRLVEASFYDDPRIDRFNIGKYTSDGEMFDAASPARAASSNLPDGTEIIVRNPENGRTSHVRINDFGPFKVSRQLDLTRRVADDLRFTKKGVTKLESYIITAPLPEDLVYRRNRNTLEPLGHIGVVEAWEVPALIERLVRQRTRKLLLPTRPAIGELAVLNEVAGVPATPLVPKQGVALDLLPNAVLPPLAALSDARLPEVAALGPDDDTIQARVEGRVTEVADARRGPVVLAAGPASLVPAIEGRETISDHLYTEIARWLRVPAHGHTLPTAFAFASSVAILFGWMILSLTAQTRYASGPQRLRDVGRKLDNAKTHRPLAKRVINASDPATSFLGTDVAIEGRLTSAGRIRIAGHVSGSVTADECELLYDGGVDGEITAYRVAIAGEFCGTIRAETVVVRRSASVTGDVYAMRIEIENGAEVDARIEARATRRPARLLKPQVEVAALGQRHETPLRLVSTIGAAETAPRAPHQPATEPERVRA